MLENGNCIIATVSSLKKTHVAKKPHMQLAHPTFQHAYPWCAFTPNHLLYQKSLTSLSVYYSCVLPINQNIFDTIVYHLNEQIFQWKKSMEHHLVTLFLEQLCISNLVMVKNVSHKCVANRCNQHSQE